MRSSPTVVAAFMLTVGCSPPKKDAIAGSDARPDKVAAVAPQDSDGPFGISMGEQPQKLGGVENGKPGFYKIDHVPRPYPTIETYVVKAGPNSGVCWIKAISQDVDSSAFGGELRSATDKVKDDLAEKYGQPKAIDILMSGSIWKDPQDWLMGLAKGDRMYAYEWDRPAGADAKSWRGVNKVYTYANGEYQKGYVDIEYYFDNGAVCDAELKKSAAKAL